MRKVITSVTLDKELVSWVKDSGNYSSVSYACNQGLIELRKAKNRSEIDISDIELYGGLMRSGYSEVKETERIRAERNLAVAIRDLRRLRKENTELLRF